MRIEDALVEYLRAKRVEGCSPATMRNLQQRLIRLTRFLHKQRLKRLTEVQSKDIDEYAALLIRHGASFQTRCAYLRTVRGFFRWLYDRGKLLANPARDIEPPAREQEPLPPPPLTEEEAATILERMPRRSVVDLRNGLHMELFYSCGLRVQETLELKLGDIDLSTRSLRVLGKGGKVRILPLMRGAMGVLQNYLALRRTLLRGPDTGVLLLAAKSGRALSAASVSKLMDTVQKRLQLKRRIHPHLLRHSIAIHMLQRGADIRHVQEFLGHASIDTTKIYLRMVPGRLKEDYDRSMPTIPVQP